jgi:hypothetical protein
VTERKVQEDNNEDASCQDLERSEEKKGMMTGEGVFSLLPVNKQHKFTY